MGDAKKFKREIMNKMEMAEHREIWATYNLDTKRLIWVMNE